METTTYATLPVIMYAKVQSAQARRTIRFGQGNTRQVIGFFQRRAHHLFIRGQRRVAEGTKRNAQKIYGHPNANRIRIERPCAETPSGSEMGESFRLVFPGSRTDYDRCSNASSPRGVTSWPPARRIAYILVARTVGLLLPLARTGHAASQRARFIKGDPILITGSWDVTWLPPLQLFV